LQVRLLLAAGAPLRARDKAKQSALHHAARAGNLEVRNPRNPKPKPLLNLEDPLDVPIES
jgi:ankyrin repeat protein